MRFTKFLKFFFQYSFYLFVFLLPWQTKLILRSGETNFIEISLYVSQLILLVILVAFFIYRYRHKDTDRGITSVWYFLAGLEIFIFASFFKAPDQVLAFYHYVVFLQAIGLFYLLREGTFFKGYEESYFDKLSLIYIFLTSIFFQAVLGIYQFFTQSTFAFKYLGLAAHDPQNLGVAVIETASGRFLRAYGGFDHPNIFGGVLAISLILVAYLLVKKKVLDSNRQVFESICFFIFYFSALFALFFTFSRAAWLAYAVGLFVLLISLIVKKDRWMIGRFLALIFFSAILLAIIAQPYQDLLAVRIEATTRLEQKSINERMLYIGQAKNLIKQNPFFGTGIGNYEVVLANENAHQLPAYANQPVHNGFLLVLSENGLFAFLFFAGFLVCLIIKDRRETYSWAILAALIVLLMVDHWLISLPFGIFFLFFILGLI